MERSEFDVVEYLNQFNIISAPDIDCKKQSEKLYQAILTKFKISMTVDEYEKFKEFQERTYDLVENLRELDVKKIALVLNYLNKDNYYLIDVVIMLWCLPEVIFFLSKKIYFNKYRQNIQKYHHKMIELVEEEPVKNFCFETLTKTNSVPVHCIDYLWLYINNMSFELTFFNSDAGNYISFTMPHDQKDEYINLGLNMEYLLELGLGQTIYENDPQSKGSFRNFLKIFVTNTDVITKMSGAPTGKNYKNQLKNILSDPKKYFGDDFQN